MTLAELIDTVTTDAYLAELEAWRAQTEPALRADWISLVGRFELHPGIYLVGANPYAEIRLPADSAPDHVGVLTVTAEEVAFAPAPEVDVLINGAPLKGAATLRSDGDTVRTPDIVTLGSITFFVIERGPRTILRVRDANSPAVAAFGGRRWFAADPAYRVVATFTPYDPPLAVRPAPALSRLRSTALNISLTPAAGATAAWCCTSATRPTVARPTAAVGRWLLGRSKMVGL
jgi:uncharacterized protein (DUF1684 family)